MSALELARAVCFFLLREGIAGATIACTWLDVQMICVVRGTRSYIQVVRSTRYEVLHPGGPQYKVRVPTSRWSGVQGARSAVRGPRSEVRGPRSGVCGPRLYGADVTILKFDLQTSSCCNLSPR